MQRLTSLDFISFFFVINLEICKLSFPDNLKIAIPEGPLPVDSANIFIYFFLFFHNIEYMENTISFNTKFGWITAAECNNKITSIQFKTKRKGKVLQKI